MNFTVKIEVGEAAMPLDLLAERTDLSRSRIKEAMTKGAVWLTRGRRTRRFRRAKGTALPGDLITLCYDDAVLARQVLRPQLIEDAGAWSVWYKPAGLLSSGSRFGDHTAINRLVELEWQRPVFLVHRLDQYASGLMVLAHNKAAAADLSSQFQHRTVCKIYQARVEGALEIAEPPMEITIALDDRRAITRVRTLESGLEESLVEVEIETGRKHQIRRHLAAIGHPILGDRQYGSRHRCDLALVACELSFRSPGDGLPRAYRLPGGVGKIPSVADNL